MPPKKGKSKSNQKNSGTSSNPQAHVSGGEAIGPTLSVVETVVSQKKESDVSPQTSVSGGEATSRRIKHEPLSFQEKPHEESNSDDDWLNGDDFTLVGLKLPDVMEYVHQPPKTDSFSPNFAGRHLPVRENDVFAVDQRKEIDLSNIMIHLDAMFKVKLMMMKQTSRKTNPNPKPLNTFRCAVGGGELAGKVRDSRFELALPYNVLVRLSLAFFGLNDVLQQDNNTLKMMFGEMTNGTNVVQMFCTTFVPKEILEQKAKSIDDFVKKPSICGFISIFDKTLKPKQPKKPNQDLFAHIVRLLLKNEMDEPSGFDQYFNEFIMSILFKLNRESLFSSKRSTLNLVNISMEILDRLHISSLSTKDLDDKQISEILLVIQIFKKLKEEPNTEDACLQIFQALFQCLTFKGKEEMLVLCFNHPHEFETYSRTMIEKSGPEHLNRIRGSKSTKGQINPVEMWDRLTKTPKNIHLWLHSIGCGKTTIAIILTLLDAVIHEKHIVYMGPETLTNMMELSSICNAVQTFLDREKVNMRINFVSGSPVFPKESVMKAAAKQSISLFVIRSLTEIVALSGYNFANKLTIIIDDNTEVELGKDLKWLMKLEICNEIHLLGATLDLSTIDPEIMSEIDILGKPDGSSTAICAAEPSCFLRGFPLSLKALSDMKMLGMKFLSSYQRVREIIDPVCVMLQSFAGLEQINSDKFVLQVQQILNMDDNRVFNFFYPLGSGYQPENETDISSVKRKLATLLERILKMFPKTGIVPNSGRFPTLDDLDQILNIIFSAAEASSGMIIQEFMPDFQLPFTREFCYFFRRCNEFISQMCVMQYEDVAKYLSNIKFPDLELRFYDVCELADLTKQATPIIDCLASFGLAFDCAVLTPPKRVRVSNRNSVMPQIIHSRDNGGGCPIVCLGPNDDFRTVSSQLADISSRKNRLIESQEEKRFDEDEVREIHGQSQKKVDKKTSKEPSKEPSKESSKEPSEGPSEGPSEEKSSSASASASASATSSSVADDHSSPNKRLRKVVDKCKLNLRQTAHLPSQCDNQTAMNLLLESGSPEATRWLEQFCKGVSGVCQQMPLNFVKLCLDMFQKGKMILVIQEKIFHLQSMNFNCGELPIFLHFLSEVSDAFAKQMIGRAGRIGTHRAGRVECSTPSGHLIRSKIETKSSVQDVSVLDFDKVANTLSKLPRRFVLDLLEFLSKCQFKQHEISALIEFLRLYQLLQYDKTMEYSCKHRDFDKIMQFMSSCGIVSYLSDFEFSSSAHISERLKALAVNAECSSSPFDFTNTRDEFVKTIHEEITEVIVPRALGLCQVINEGTFIGLGINRPSLVNIFMEIGPLYRPQSLSNLVSVFMSFLTNLQRSPIYTRDQDIQDHLLALITMMDHVNRSLQRLVEILTKVLTERDFDCFYSRKAVVLSPFDILRKFLETATTVDDVHQFFLQNPAGLERESKQFDKIHSSFGPNSQTEQLLKVSQGEFESLSEKIKTLRSQATKKVGTFPASQRARAQKEDSEILSINAQISSIKMKIENLHQSIEMAKSSLEKIPQTEGEFLDFIRNIFK